MRTDQIVAGSSPTLLASGQLDVSVIIVSFNTRDVLRKCLQHLRISVEGVSAEVIVIDNNSSDGSANLVELEFPEVQLIRSRENMGFAAANNLAFRNARREYLVLLNSDAFVSRDAIRLAFCPYAGRPGIGLGGARLVGRTVRGSLPPEVSFILNVPAHLDRACGPLPKITFFRTRRPKLGRSRTAHRCRLGSGGLCNRAEKGSQLPRRLR